MARGIHIGCGERSENTTREPARVSSSRWRAFTKDRGEHQDRSEGARGPEEKAAERENQFASGAIGLGEAALKLAEKFLMAIGCQVVEDAAQDSCAGPCDDRSRTFHRMLKDMVVAIDGDEAESSEHRAIVLGLADGQSLFEVNANGCAPKGFGGHGAKGYLSRLVAVSRHLHDQAATGFEGVKAGGEDRALIVRPLQSRVGENHGIGIGDVEVAEIVTAKSHTVAQFFIEAGAEFERARDHRGRRIDTSGEAVRERRASSTVCSPVPHPRSRMFSALFKLSR